MDKGTFRAELIAVGLGDTEELAKVLEVSERQAQYIKRDPSRLTKDRYKKLCEWLDNEDIRLQFLARDTDNMKEQGCATEDEESTTAFQVMRTYCGTTSPFQI